MRHLVFFNASDISQANADGTDPHKLITVSGTPGCRYEIEALQVAPGVDNVVAIAQPFKLVSRQVKPERTVVNVGGVPIGGPGVVIIAGPCSVESREQLLTTAHCGKARRGYHASRRGLQAPYFSL